MTDKNNNQGFENDLTDVSSLTLNSEVFRVSYKKTPKHILKVKCFSVISSSRHVIYQLLNIMCNISILILNNMLYNFHYMTA